MKKLQQLRIFTAGIWNNIVLALVAFALLFSVPFLSSALYSKDLGVTVTHVEPNSTILGPSGLKVGDVVTSVNGCNVKGRNQWHHCLSLADQVKKERKITKQKIEKITNFKNVVVNEREERKKL